MEKPSEIDIRNDNFGISVLSGHMESLSSVIPYQQRIPRKNKIKKTSDALITRKETIQEPISPSKRSKYDTIPDVGKEAKNKDLQRFGIRYTTKVILMRRLMVLMILQVKLIVV